MPQFPMRAIDFKHGNSWGVRDGVSEVTINHAKLLHAAITVGHRGTRGRRAMLTENDWLAELNRKKATFEGIIKDVNVPHGNGLREVSRLQPRKSLTTLDPTEKGILNYQFGMTMATAWAREVLGVPWLLHLDVYYEAMGMSRPQGTRGDMIGRHPDGRWIVVEAKGFRKKPTRSQQTEAKEQARQITNIGGTKPVLHVAVLSFFAPDVLASARPKPDVAQLWAVDPPPGEDGSRPGNLSNLATSDFLKFYYEQWAFLFRANAAFEKSSSLLWMEPRGSHLRIGIIPEVFYAVQEGDYRPIPMLINAAQQRWSLMDEYAGWIGDGIVVEHIA